MMLRWMAATREGASTPSHDVTSPPQSPPCATYRGRPSAEVISSSQTRAMSRGLIGAGGAEDQP